MGDKWPQLPAHWREETSYLVPRTFQLKSRLPSSEVEQQAPRDRYRDPSLGAGFTHGQRAIWCSGGVMKRKPRMCRVCLMIQDGAETLAYTARPAEA